MDPGTVRVSPCAVVNKFCGFKSFCCSCSSVAKAVRITNNVTVDDDVVVAMGTIGVDDVAVGNVEVLLQLQ